MTEPFEYGAMLRTTTAHHEDGYKYNKGVEFEVEDYVTAEEADADDGYGYYYGSNHGGINNVEVREDHVELVRTLEEMRARTLPSISDIAEHIGSEALGGDFDIRETDWAGGEGVINLYGTTPEGLPFAAVVKVLSVESTDF
ncbi:hypothetical protein [Paenarthrobacter sp. JL.01a]|uniref:hypothetical protein n=1 Tax=Paenarthrobacter sp. JL.01a TaxID=2979324 RepID=UPI0021C5E4DE|nr:hypothetical protein [Paenarthrobacter sp. JL.01a]UXM92536.1 hypothetical protein N5P29_04200 [Paenarthrobacter sp. JL.01a]